MVEKLPKRWARPLFAAYLAVLIFPLLLSQLQRPFAFWDDLTIPGKLYLGWAHDASSLPAAIRYYWFGESYVFRPVMLLFYNLFYLVFGGEFWILQLLKIAARAGYLVLTASLLRSLGFETPARLAVFVFLLFHPALTDMMLFGDDTWLALAMAATLAVAVREDRWFDLAPMSLLRYLAFAALTVFALGAKEAGVVFALLVCLATAWRTAPAGRWRLLPLWTFTTYAIWHLAWMVAKGLRANTPEAASSNKLEVLAEHWNYVTLRFPLHLSQVALPLLVAWGAYRFWKSSGADRRLLLALVLAAAAGILAFTSNVQHPAIRYVVPVVVLLAVPLASAVEGLGRYARPAAIAFAILFPLTMVGNWYWLALRYGHTLDQFTQVLTALERKAQTGLALAVSEDLAPETRYAVIAYFERYARQFYGAAESRKVSVAKALPGGPAVLVTARRPPAMHGEPGYASRTQAVESFAPGREGALPALTHFYLDVRRRLGFHVLLHDLFFPEAPGGTMFYVHTLAAQASPAVAVRHEVRPGGQFRLAIPAGAPFTLDDTVYEGRIKVESGGVLFGFEAEGVAVWETPLNPGPDWIALPKAPALLAPAGRPLLLTVRVPAAAVFSLEGPHVAPVTAVAPARRYGALVR